MAENKQNNPNSIANSSFYAGYPPWHMDRKGNTPSMKAPGGAAGVRMGNPQPQVVSYNAGTRTTNNYNTTNHYNNAAAPAAARQSAQAPAPAGPAKYVKYQPKEYDAYAKQKRKERDYFFVMRKGVCFFMMLFALIIFVVIAQVIMFGITGLPVVDSYTAMFEEPGIADFVPFGDAVYGLIDKVIGGDNAALFTFQANADAVASGVQAHPEDTMGSIAVMLVQYYPAAIVILAIFALVVAILCFCSLFGKKIYKGFGALAIVMLVMGLIITVAGLAVLGAKSGAPYIDTTTGLLVSVLDFSNFINFLTGAEGLVYTAGFGLVVAIAGSLLLLLFSIFARRKVPYSIFDR